MNSENLNSWLGLLANFGVLIGIVFLAIELNQSNRQAESATYQARINEIDQSQREYATSNTLPGIYVKIRESGVESLTPEEFERAYIWELARISRMQGQFYQYQQGFLDEDSYSTMIEVGVSRLQLWKELGITTVFRELLDTFEEAALASEYE